MDEQQKAQLAAVVPANVARVYSGMPGCGCGCRGKYYDGGRMIARVLNAVKARADEATVTTFGQETIYALEDARRYYWVYIKV